MAKHDSIITVRMDCGLHRNLERLAHRREVSLNALCDATLHREACQAIESGELRVAVEGRPGGSVPSEGVDDLKNRFAEEDRSGTLHTKGE